MDAPLGGDALCGLSPLFPKGLVQTQLFALLRVFSPAALAAARTAGAALAPVPGGGHKLALFFLRIFPAECEFPALSTGETVVLRLIRHVLDSAYLF